MCHSGRCGPCPEEGERHCPCGKALFLDLKCDEKAPLCVGGTCGKTLDCGVHTCEEGCQSGPCYKVRMGAIRVGLVLRHVARSGPGAGRGGHVSLVASPRLWGAHLEETCPYGPCNKVRLLRR